MPAVGEGRLADGMTLPNFLIVGASKAGTTSLYHYLRQHPDVFMSPVKEPMYYCPEIDNADAVRTREAYERLFDGVTTERAIGEASPLYLNSPTAAARIAADLPDARIIVSLRNPAERAYSSYLGQLREGKERRGVDEAMQPESYFCQTSLYHPRLLRYFERFGRERIKVAIFEDLAADARAVLRGIHKFLGVDLAFETDVATQHNRAAVPKHPALNAVFFKTAQRLHELLPPKLRNTGLAGRVHRRMLKPPPPLPPEIRARMLEHFRDDIARTSALIGRDLSFWLA